MSTSQQPSLITSSRPRRLGGVVSLIGMLLVLNGCGGDKDSIISEAEVIQVPDGFIVDTLYSPSAHGQGSWISMTVDQKGRLIASSERGRLYRIVPPPIGSPASETKVDSLDVEIGFVHGMVWAFNSLYVVVSTDEGLGNHNTGLYRLRDRDGDDHFEDVSLLSSFDVAMPEHGPHGIVLGPDSTSLYLIAGNHTDLPENYSSRIRADWAEDNLFTSIRDPGGHATNRLAPGGWVAKTDSNGTDWEIVSVGLRNPYDLVFNASGDLFTFDADMEWDLGLPWYRPIRLCHVTSGSEFGWRTGSGKWPPHYLDSVAPILEVGQGSPTGLVSVRGGRFPRAFQNSLLLFDWTYGTIYKVDLDYVGAGYRARAEPFLSGTPLPLTDGVMGLDGALYFITGGRNLTSYLFRVYHSDPSAPVQPTTLPPLARLRRAIESNHGPNQSLPTDSLLSLLGHDDRLIRYAARVALEHRPLDDWLRSGLSLTHPLGRVNAVAAVARSGISKHLDEAIRSLRQMDLGSAEEEVVLDVLRSYALLFTRLGRPDSDTQAELIDDLRAMFPTRRENADREIARLLVFLGDRWAVPDLVRLLHEASAGAGPQTLASDVITGNSEYGEQLREMLETGVEAIKISYALTLSHAEIGWTDSLRRDYFEWFASALSREGGPSYKGYLDLIRGNALARLTDEERTKIVFESDEFVEDIPRTEGPGRDWSVNDVRVSLNRASGQSWDYDQALAMYKAALCHSCHPVGGSGGNIGPDLTKVWTRSSIKDIATAIIKPNDFIPIRYARVVLMKKDGGQVSGLVTNRSDTGVTLRQNVLDSRDTVFVPDDQILSTEVSPISVMPAGLLNTLNEGEVLALFAFLESEGDSTHPIFSTPAE